MRALVLLTFSALIFASSAFAHPITERISVPAPIREQMALLRKDARYADRVAAYDKLIYELTHLRYENRDVCLARTDLDAKTLNVMLANSRGVYTVEDILKRPFVKGGYSLGLSAVAGIYPMFSERLGLSPWMTAYPELDVDWEKIVDHTPVFLSRVEATSRPVVFFLPNKLLTFGRASITLGEFEWYMAKPSRMKNVFFVVGSYDLITTETHGLAEKAGLSESAFRALFMRAVGASTSQYDQDL